MNIDLKFSFDEIKYIQHLINLTRTVIITVNKSDKKFIFSIVLDIGHKIEKKALTLDEVTASLNRKRYKIKFKYHEAVILERFILDILKTETDYFNRNLGLLITNQINQKLA